MKNMWNEEELLLSKQKYEEHDKMLEQARNNKFDAWHTPRYSLVDIIIAAWVAFCIGYGVFGFIYLLDLSK